MPAAQAERVSPCVNSETVFDLGLLDWCARCFLDGPELKIFDQSERIIDRRMRVSRSHGVADTEQLKSSVLLVNSRLWSARDQIPIVNRAPRFIEAGLSSK